jgi:hypothetical protein
MHVRIHYYVAHRKRLSALIHFVFFDLSATTTVGFALNMT